MADRRISVYGKNVVPELHKMLKDAINKKGEEKNWGQHEKEEFKRDLIKVYEETVEMALRRNVVVKEGGRKTVGQPQKEMEPVNKERALEVNKMCAESEEHLTHTIRKRKHYPQKIKECLRKQHDSEMNSLCNLENEFSENKVQVDNVESSQTVCKNKGQLNLTECEVYLTRLKKHSECMESLSKSLPETKDRAQRLYTATRMDLQMKDTDLHKALFSKRKLPSSFDSILATPTKDAAESTLPESENTVTSTLLDQHRQPKKIKGVLRTDTPGKT